MKDSAYAIVLEEFSEPLAPKEYPLPKVSEGEVLVKLTAIGVCGSDVHIWSGEDPRTSRPMILGHEGLGEIVAIGKTKEPKKSVMGVELREGQTILWNRGVVCGRCYYCTLSNQPWLCQERWVYGIHKSCADPPHLRGCYASHLLLDQKTDIFVLAEPGDHKPSDSEACALVAASCSGATAAHTIERCPPEPGQTVVVQGPGPLGAFLAAFASSCGAADIIVIGGSVGRLKICEHLGATLALNRNETSVEERKEIVLGRSHGRGADVVYEAVGTAAAVEEGIGLARQGGAYLLAGFGQPGGSVTLDCFSQIVRRDINIQGVWVSHTRHTYQALKLIQSSPRQFSELITHTFPLADATDALTAMKERKAMKAVLTPGS